MATSFLSTVPKSLRNVWSIVLSGVHQGLTANKIQSTLTAVGQGVRRQTLLDGIRAIKQEQLTTRNILTMKPRLLPTLKRIPEALHDIRRTYSYTFQVDSMIEGQLSSRYVTLSTDDLLSFDDATAQMTSALEDDFFRYGRDETVSNISLTGVKQKPGVFQ
jgi:hypothetical protein